MNNEENTNIPELAPCPICGGKPNLMIIQAYGSYIGSVRCESCDHIYVHLPRKDKAWLTGKLCRSWNAAGAAR